MIPTFRENKGITERIWLMFHIFKGTQLTLANWVIVLQKIELEILYSVPLLKNNYIMIKSDSSCCI